MARKLKFDNSLTQDIQTAVNDSYVDNIKMIDIEDIEPSEDNFYSLDNIDELADDIERQGLKNVLVVFPSSDGKYILKSGHRRREAIKMLIDSGRRTSRMIPCYVDGVKSASETKIDLIMLNATARQMTDADVMQQYKELSAAYEAYEKETGNKVKGRMRERIATALSVSPAQVGKIENVLHNAVPEVTEAVEKGDVSISTANEIAKLPAEKQKELASDIKNVTHKKAKDAVEKLKDTVKKISDKKNDDNDLDKQEFYEPNIDDEFDEFPETDSGSTKEEAWYSENADNNSTFVDDDLLNASKYFLRNDEVDVLRKYLDDFIADCTGSEDEKYILERLMYRIAEDDGEQVF